MNMLSLSRITLRLVVSRFSCSGMLKSKWKENLWPVSDLRFIVDNGIKDDIHRIANTRSAIYLFS